MKSSSSSREILKMMNEGPPPGTTVKKRMKKEDRKAVRTILGMTMTCDDCGNNLERGLRFTTSIKEVDYMGSKADRLSLACPRCASAITLVINPNTTRNPIYADVSGATIV